VADLTDRQLATLRQCPAQPGARFPSTDSEEATLRELAAFGLVRLVRYYRRDPIDGARIPGYCWQRTDAGTAALVSTHPSRP
jgi:hypothetical protein